MSTITTVSPGIYGVSSAISTVGSYLGDNTTAMNVSTIGSIASQVTGTNYILTKSGSTAAKWLSPFYMGEVTLDNGSGSANNITLPAAYTSVSSYNAFVSYVGSGSPLTPMYITITDESHFTINGGTAGALVRWTTIGM
jgi:hypothetical protein